MEKQNIKNLVGREVIAFTSYGKEMQGVLKEATKLFVVIQNKNNQKFYIRYDQLQKIDKLKNNQKVL
jgi:hypothetical protein